MFNHIKLPFTIAQLFIIPLVPLSSDHRRLFVSRSTHIHLALDACFYCNEKYYSNILFSWIQTPKKMKATRIQQRLNSSDIKPVRVFNLTNNNVSVYSTIKAASNFLNIDSRVITKYCKHQHQYQNYCFTYTDA